MASPGNALTADQQRQLGDMVVRHPVADELGHRFSAAGFELYLVGGTVRDAFLDRQQDDLDFATSAAPEQTERLVRGWADDVWLTGVRFGTVSARRAGLKLEITTFRAEAYTPGSRHPQVEFARDIAADLSRRDFTLNAMAVSLPEHRFVDPFGGLGDLRDRRLRTPVDPTESFGDDPLRMVRLARFAAVLQADVDDGARKAAEVLAPTLDTVSRERIRDELLRLVCGAAPGRGLDLLVDTGLADRFLPELPALRMQRDPLHHHKDVYRHTIAVVEGCDPEDPTLRLAALLHDIGKPRTRQLHPDGKVTFHGHDHVGARMARARLRELRFPNDVVEQVRALVYLHLRFHGYDEAGWTDAAVRRYVRDAGSPLQLQRLNALTRADVTTRNREKARRLQAAMDALEARIERLTEQEELSRIRPALDGRAIMDHLGLPPGPAVGAARQMLLDARLEQGPMRPEDAYALLDRWASEQGLGR